MFAPISVTNNAEIRLFTANDEITLEYDDRGLLMFIPDIPGLIPGLEGAGEYIRDTATVHIIDNDCNCYTIVLPLLFAFVFLQCWRSIFKREITHSQKVQVCPAQLLLCITDNPRTHSQLH